MTKIAKLKALREARDGTRSEQLSRAVARRERAERVNRAAADAVVGLIRITYERGGAAAVAGRFVAWPPASSPGTFIIS